MPLPFLEPPETGIGSTLAPSVASFVSGSSVTVAASPTAGQGLTLDSGGKVNQAALVQKFRTFSNGDTTPSVLAGTVFKTANTGGTTITMFDDGGEGQIITVVFTDANTTLTDGGNLKLAGGFTSTANDTMQLVFDGTDWYELCRSVN